MAIKSQKFHSSSSHSRHSPPIMKFAGSFLIVVAISGLKLTSGSSTCDSPSLFQWSPWTSCENGKKTRDSFQKVQETVFCYENGESPAKALCKYLPRKLFLQIPNHFLFADNDCDEIFQAGHKLPGVYHIKVGLKTTAEVYCDKNGWTVFQSRGQFGNPADYFFRNWSEYQNPFGVPGNQRSG